MLETEDDEFKRCAFCKTNRGKYVCPRCQIMYCSVPCYQAKEHLNCSESFYKDCIKEEINLKSDDPESIREMCNILQRIENEADEESLDSDDEEESELFERLANVDLDDADAIWEKLTENERKGFVELLRKGDVSHIIPPWEPWWKHKEEKKLIQEIDDSTGEDIDFVESFPKVLEEIPPFDKICKNPPSACIKYNVINVLCAYAYMTQYFGGDHHNFSMEAVNALLILSNNIRVGTNYDSAEVAIESAVSEASTHQWLSGHKEFQKTVKNAVKCIIEGPSAEKRNLYILSALSDIHRLIEKAKSEKGKVTEEKSAFAKKFCDSSLFSLPPVSKSKLSAYMKKMEYYLSWSKTFAVDEYSLE